MTKGERMSVRGVRAEESPSEWKYGGADARAMEAKGKEALRNRSGAREMWRVLHFLDDDHRFFLSLSSSSISTRGFLVF